jgi:hypothetical protein
MRHTCTVGAALLCCSSPRAAASIGMVLISVIVRLLRQRDAKINTTKVQTERCTATLVIYFNERDYASSHIVLGKRALCKSNNLL